MTPATQIRRDRELPWGVLAVVAVGGSLGAVSRYAVSMALPTRAGHMPWGTLLINWTGSAVLGFLLVTLMHRAPGGRMIRAAVGTGFLGGYTTFSTLAVETDQSIRGGDVGLAVLYVLASAAGGLLLAWVGMAVARATMAPHTRLEKRQ